MRIDAVLLSDVGDDDVSLIYAERLGDLRVLELVAGDPDVIARGFNLTDEIESEIVRTVRDTVAAADFEDSEGLGDLARAVKKAVRKLFYRDRQFPVIVPIIVED